MKKETNSDGVSPKPAPILSWQTEEYERHAEFKFILPYQFLLLCKLMNVTPQDILLDFMDNLDAGSSNRNGRDKAKEFLLEYFVAHRYGQPYYSEEEIRSIFREMDSMGSLFPTGGNIPLMELYSQWRNEHLVYWFKKWFEKPRRTL